jgi:hypothetical protein
VKCNSDPTLLAWLAGLGTGFDCASTEELYTVLSLNVDPARIIFSNPCKAPAALIFARQVGVTRMTFDNLDELDKICTYIPEAQLLLRTHASDDSALIPLGDKFGAHLDTTKQLLLRAWDLGLNVAGISFHIGEYHHRGERTAWSDLPQEQELGIQSVSVKPSMTHTRRSRTPRPSDSAQRSSTLAVDSKTAISSPWPEPSAKPSPRGSLRRLQ